MKLCAMQVQAGRLFIHEHPSEARSWHEDCVTYIAALDGVYIAIDDMCAMGIAMGMRVDTGGIQGTAWACPLIQDDFM